MHAKEKHAHRPRAHSFSFFQPSREHGGLDPSSEQSSRQHHRQLGYGAKASVASQPRISVYVVRRESRGRFWKEAHYSRGPWDLGCPADPKTKGSCFYSTQYPPPQSQPLPTASDPHGENPKRWGKKKTNPELVTRPRGLHTSLAEPDSGRRGSI